MTVILKEEDPMATQRNLSDELSASSNQVVTLSDDEYLLLGTWQPDPEYDSYSMDEWCFGYKAVINHTGFSRDEIKIIVENLKAKGFLKYYRGLMGEEGEMGGSGWGVTRSGTDAYYERLEQVTDLVSKDPEANNSSSNPPGTNPINTEVSNGG